MTEQQFRLAAADQYEQEHYLIFDDNAQVNITDLGAYVAAWVWIDDPSHD